MVRKFLGDVIAVTSNEFRVLKHNRTAILLSLVILPLFFTLSLGAGRGGAGTTFSPTERIPIAYVDNDLTVASSRVYAILARSGDFDDLIQGYSEGKAIAMLGSGKIYAVIVVPQGFQDMLLNDQVGHMIVYVDDSVDGLGSELQDRMLKSLRDFNPRLDVQPVSEGVSSPVEIVAKGTIYSGFVVGLTIILGLVTIFATFYEIAGGMSRESEEGTFARLLTSPTGLGAIMTGKTIYDLGLNTIRTLTVLGIGVYLYGARPNTDVVTIIALSLLIALVTMGFAFIVSAFGLGVRAVIIIEFFLVLFLFAFSGFIIDRELLRGFSKTISYALPWAYGIEVLRGAVLVGRSPFAMIREITFVVVGAVVFYVVAYFLLRSLRERLIT
jgi:ABC-type multidrug transport system permease subunit